MSVTNTEISDRSNAERLQIRKERLALLRSNKAFIIGVSILGFWILCAIFGKFVTPFAIDEQNYEFVSVGDEPSIAAIASSAMMIAGIAEIASRSRITMMSNQPLK